MIFYSLFKAYLLFSTGATVIDIHMLDTYFVISL
jgi:hypothetical protein